MIAALAVQTGIPMSVLLAEPYLDEMVEAAVERAQAGSDSKLVPDLEAMLGEG